MRQRPRKLSVEHLVALVLELHRLSMAPDWHVHGTVLLPARVAVRSCVEVHGCVNEALHLLRAIARRR